MSVSYEGFLDNLTRLRAEIAAACAQAGRNPSTVNVLPVTKNHPPEAVGFVARAGLPAVGENRVQEAHDKKASCTTLALRWELIGHLQSNKVRLAASGFDRIQSVDSVRLLDLLERSTDDLGRVLPILVQVNAGHDQAKFGCDLADAPALVEAALARSHLRLDGLMAIAPLTEDRDVARRTFEALRACRDTLADRFRVPLPELSMGMSDDWRAAVLAGSTQIRIGTALFGARG
jgi:PLP dependent protein